jgi:hypothetical protein
MKSNAGGVAVSYASASRTTGEIGLLAVTYSDDPSADNQGSMVYRAVGASMLVGVISAGMGGTLRVGAEWPISGSSVILPRDQTPTGLAYAALQFWLRATSTSGAETSEFFAGPCHVAGPPPYLSYNQLSQSVSEVVSGRLSMPVGAGDQVLISLTAQVLVGVTKEANLYANVNYSPLQNWFQRAGSISASEIWAAIC